VVGTAAIRRGRRNRVVKEEANGPCQKKNLFTANGHMKERPTAPEAKWKRALDDVTPYLGGGAGAKKKDLLRHAARKKILDLFIGFFFDRAAVRRERKRRSPRALTSTSRERAASHNCLRKRNGLSTD